MLYDKCNIEQNEARHCSQSTAVRYRKTFGPRIEHVGFFELDIFSQTELLIGE